MEKQTYEHKGVTITYEPARDEYVAVIRGESISAGSLKVVRALIETEQSKGKK